MLAVPGEDLAESHLEMLDRREAVLRRLDGALDLLDPIEQEVIDAIVFEHLSLRDIAERFQGRSKSIGKTWVAHIRDEALRKMRHYLLAQDVVSVTKEPAYPLDAGEQ